MDVCPFAFTTQMQGGSTKADLVPITQYGNDWSVQMLQLLGVPSDRIAVRIPGKVQYCTSLQRCCCCCCCYSLHTHTHTHTFQVYHGNTVFFARPIPLHRPYPQLLKRARLRIASRCRHAASLSQRDASQLAGRVRQLAVGLECIRPC